MPALRTRFFLTLIVLLSVSRVAFSAECDSAAAKKVNLDLWSKRSLLSPDRKWTLVSAGSDSPEKQALLYIRGTGSSKSWLIGRIERNGTVFWSRDSKRLFLRDEYAADDTRIRVFDVTGLAPEEIKGLNEQIQKALFTYIPKNKTTLWLHYPDVCFAANDSSIIIVRADAPLVPKVENGRGVPFSVKLTLNVVSGHVIDAASNAR